MLPVAEQMDTWAHQDPAVAVWVAQYLDTPDGTDHAGRALAGAVIAWTRIHGVVSLEVEGLYNGMGHQPQTLLEVEMNMLADTFRLG
ncbi:TetR-like C-terminal domain-containing protein [Streptomyces sp900116325]|uniref:TetR-like C-terminal domain-containing protein n=1 Tax=Streptomyces sp. 900116325 TaxID=3154295 RepID=A0ABV2UJQ7_9ACTN